MIWLNRSLQVWIQTATSVVYSRKQVDLACKCIAHMLPATNMAYLNFYHLLALAAEVNFYIQQRTDHNHCTLLHTAND